MPSPAHTATMLYTVLSWVAAGATKFNIYFGTVPVPPLIITNYVGTSYVPTVTPATTFYWQIVALNDGGQMAGPIWYFTTPKATDVLVTLGGSLTGHVRGQTLQIRDALNAQPNTALFDLDTGTTSPQRAEVKIGLGSLDIGNLLFGGTIQTIGETYQGRLTNITWPAAAVDHTFTLNRHRPFGTFVNVSASTVALALAAQYAPDFTTAHVQQNLPTVTINFDGSQDFMGCLSALATAIGGYSDVDYGKDLHLFLTEPTDGPDPLDATHPPLNDPPIQITTEYGQVRTIVYGKGHGENVPCDVAAGETLIPIPDASQFTPSGGQAIAATTADGAQTQILTYAGVQLGGGGSLVGPGASPSSAPILALAAGSALGAGTYQYAYTDVTGAGESLPSPIASVITGPLAAPGAAPSGSPSAGGSVNAGDHLYAVTFVASGETTPGPNSATVTTYDGITDPSAQITFWFSDGGPGGPLSNGTYLWGYTFVTAHGETVLGSSTFSGAVVAGAHVHPTLPAGPSGTTARRYYRSAANGSSLRFVAEIGGNASTNYTDATTDAALGAASPSSNTTSGNTVVLNSIAIGPSGVTARKVYRTVIGGAQLKLVTTINDNTSTSFNDTIADGSLGANAPTSNTALRQQVSLTGIAIGPSSTTQRKVYRTAVSASQLKLLTTIADNTTTTFTDATADGSLGANAPTGDTSGLTQPTGQALAGSTSLLTASAAPFPVNGWVSLPGSQTVRYTGISGNTLTGIPASGSGSITTSVLYGAQVLPMPALTGVNSNNGLSLAMAKGSSVNIWVKRADLTAQAQLAAVEGGGDGIREHLIVDERRSETSLAALCDADLAQFSRPIVTVTYATHDRKTRSGKMINVNLQGYASVSGLRRGGLAGVTLIPQALGQQQTLSFVGSFVIQDVAISIETPGSVPRYAVTASSVKFSFEDMLRRVLVG